MSYIVGSEPAKVHDQPGQQTNGYDATAGGQQHDRIQVAEQSYSNMSSSNAPNITVTQRMISATWGSVLTSLLVTPLDVVRVRLQSQGSTPSPFNQTRFPAYTTSFKQLPPDLGITACCREVFWVGDNGQFCLAGNGNTNGTSVAADCAVEETQRKTFNSTYDGLKKIARNEGVLTLWRGLSPTLVMAIPANVIYFTGYDWLRYNNSSPIRLVANDTYAPLVAGSVARVAAAIAVSPIEMFRTRMQASSSETAGIFKETFQGLNRMTQTQGYSSLWRGLTLTMWRDVPFSALYWWGYESFRNQFSRARQRAHDQLINSEASQAQHHNVYVEVNNTTTFMDSFAAGAASGAIAAFITTPFDVGKTRQQVYRYSGDDTRPTTAAKEAAKAAKSIPEELTMPKFLYHIFREEGLSGLFRGWAARCLKVAPACAIMISSYEVGKRWAKSINERTEEPSTV